MQSELTVATGRRAVPGSREFLAIIALCMAMAALSIDLMLPAFPEMRAAFGLDEDSTEISLVITGFFIGLGFGQLVYGPVSDRFGRKRVLYVGIAVYIVGAVASTQADSLGAFVACRIVWGFGAACPRSLALAILRDTFEGDRMARVMSNVMATFILVPVVAPSIGSGLLALGGWHLTLWFPVGFAVLLTVWIALRLPETLPTEKRRSVAPSALLDAAGAVVRNRQTMAFCAASTFLFGIMTSYVGSTQVIVEEVFGEEDLFPIIFGALAIGLALGSLPGRQARHADRSGPPGADRCVLRRRLRRVPGHRRDRHRGTPAAVAVPRGQCADAAVGDRAGAEHQHRRHGARWATSRGWPPPSSGPSRPSAARCSAASSTAPSTGRCDRSPSARSSSPPPRAPRCGSPG